MAARKLRLGLIFGGRSGEHEVSLLSARSVLAAINRDKYDVTQIGITRDGRWIAGGEPLKALAGESHNNVTHAALLAEPGHHALMQVTEQAGQPATMSALGELDVVFPLLHGTLGEDGTVQGLLELAGLPYVGCGVLSSALGMDKGVFKDVMRVHEIPVLESFVALRPEIEVDVGSVIRRAEALAPYPLFTKPANLGSSVGVSKCHQRAELVTGLQKAAQYDRRVLVERGIDRAREIEVAVLGNDDAMASVPGEVVPSQEFYSYESKYLDAGSQLMIPAPISPELSEDVQRYAVTAFKAIDGAGMARVDFLLDHESGAVYLNEINTVPGFTRISMYPKLWDASGVPYPELIDRLVTLALARHGEKERTLRTYRPGPG